MAETEKIKPKKQLVNLVTYGMGQGFNLVTPLLVAPYLYTVFGAEGVGKIGVGMALSFFLIVIIDYGSDIIGVKDVSVNRDDKVKLGKILSTAYTARFFLLCAVLAVMALIYCTVPYFSREKELFLLGLPILIGQFINPTWVFQGVENFKGITILTIASKIIYVAGVFLTAKNPGNYIYVNLWWGIGMIVANLIAFINLSSAYKITLGNTSKAEVIGFLKGNFSMVSSQLFLSLQLYSPIMLISFFTGDAMAGKYRIIEIIVTPFKTYIFLFFNYVYPRVCYLLEKNVKEGLRFWKLYNGANFLFIALCMSVLYVLAGPVIHYFDKEAKEEVIGLLHFGILLPLVLSISIPLKQLLLGWNHEKFYVRLTMVMVAFNIVLLVVLLKFFEIYGVLASLIITEVITALLYAVVIKKKLFRLN